MPAIVFVSRQIPTNGSDYWPMGTRSEPGVGPHSRFRPAAPGKLIVRESDGTLRVLVDGAAPTIASLNLIDVNAPDVSYDGETIVFAGLPQGTYESRPQVNLNAWRIYSIRRDGSGLRQITSSDQVFSLEALQAAFPALPSGQFQAAGRFFGEGFDDTDPAFLPDGRIVFSSTRWYSIAQYSGVRTSNLHVVSLDGSGLHRITSERNGAERPLVDPLTGRIVYARWWRNHRFPANDLATVYDPSALHQPWIFRREGLTTDADNHVSSAMWRNAWHAATIAPDGTGLAMWTGSFREEDANHFYGGSFAANGDLYGNYFPMLNMTEASGFGGVRRYRRGPRRYEPVIGTTALDPNLASISPPSFGVGHGPFASDPAALPDGRLVVSWAPDYLQDYGLYTVNADGSGLYLLYDNPGTTELRAHVVAPRPLPPIHPDTSGTAASLLPPPASGPYDQDGTFTFDALNVYANGPVDADIVNAIPVGSAATIRFFIDQQRSSPGSFPGLDWPIELDELPITSQGAVRTTLAPANVPLFEQLRGPLANGYRVPVAGEGAAHVAGMNFGRPGQVARCVGCHAGHTMIAVPPTDEEAEWSNLAPGAEIAVSSSRDARYDYAVTDRQVERSKSFEIWTSPNGQTSGQWVKLTFPVPVTVRSVRLWRPQQGGEASSTLQVTASTVRLYEDVAASHEIASAPVGPLAITGSEVSFADVPARVVRVDLDVVSGTFYGMRVASIGEIEVIARPE